VAVFALDIVPPLQRVGERAMFDGTYDELAAIDALMPEPLPVVYDGLLEHPRDFFWANSSRVLASPLSETFSRQVLNPAGPLGPDARPDADEVVELLQDAHAPRAYLLQVRPDDRWTPVDPSLAPEVLGEVTVPIERLEGRSAVRPEDQPWVTTTLHVRVVRVAAAARDGAVAAAGP